MRTTGNLLLKEETMKLEKKRQEAKKRRAEDRVEKAMIIFEEKLVRSNYSEEEVKVIIAESKKLLLAKLLKNNLGILWTFDLQEGKSDGKEVKAVPKNLVNIFKKAKIDINPLGFYVLEVELNRKKIKVSEKKGHKPKPVDL